VPYDAPGQRVEVTYDGGADGETPIFTNRFAVVDNKVLLLTKTGQPDRFVRPDSEEISQIAPGEVCTGFQGGVHEVLLQGLLSAVSVGDKLWIDSISNAIFTAAGGGAGAANEVQSVKVEGSGGFWSPKVLGEVVKLKWNATKEEVQLALEATDAINPGDVVVTGGPGNVGGTTPYIFTFGGRFADTDVAAITATDELTGGEEKVTITTSTPGAASADAVFPLGVVDEIDPTRNPHVARVNANALNAFMAV
jgi:hypothetical protein